MRFKEGDVIEANGRKYKISNMDISAIDNKVRQYDLDGVGHDIIARLKPHSDGATLIEYIDVSGEIEVIGERDE